MSHLRKRKFTKEKVLYWIEQKAGNFNVHVDEVDEVTVSTDFSSIIKKLLKHGQVVESHRDEGEAYFKVTLRGEIELCHLQRQWRKLNGKGTATVEKKLRTLIEKRDTELEKSDG